MANDAHLITTSRRTRRWILGGAALAVVAGGGGFASKWYNVFADLTGEGILSVAEAYQQGEAGAIYLIDIRRPDEWTRTGVAAPAIPLDMRRDDFESVLRKIFAQTGARPVALICARGVRSGRMNARLKEAGFSDIIDVPEGMLGSGAGLGYLDQGLPLRGVTAAELNGQV